MLWFQVAFLALANKFAGDSWLFDNKEGGSCTIKLKGVRFTGRSNKYLQLSAVFAFLGDRYDKKNN